MANQQLIDYIAQAKAAGKSQEEIKSILLTANWIVPQGFSEELIHNAISVK